MTAEQKVIYQQTLIERGLLLPPKSPGRQVTKDPFKDVAAELFVAESKPTFRGQQGKKRTASGARKKKLVTKRRTTTKRGARTRKSSGSDSSTGE